MLSVGYIEFLFVLLFTRQVDENLEEKSKEETISISIKCANELELYIETEIKISNLRLIKLTNEQLTKVHKIVIFSANSSEFN